MDCAENKQVRPFSLTLTPRTVQITLALTFFLGFLDSEEKGYSWGANLETPILLLKDERYVLFKVFSTSN